MERIVRIGDRAFVTHGNTTDAYTLLCIIAAGILRRASQRFQYGLVIRDKYIHIRQHPVCGLPGKISSVHRNESIGVFFAINSQFRTEMLL